MAVSPEESIEYTIESLEDRLIRPIYVELHRCGMNNGQSVILIYDDRSGKGLVRVNRDNPTTSFVDARDTHKEPCRERWNLPSWYVSEHIEAGIERLTKKGYDIKCFDMTVENN